MVSVSRDELTVLCHWGIIFLAISINVLFLLLYVILGYCLSAMFENVSVASLLSVPVDFISYTFSGIFLQLR